MKRLLFGITAVCAAASGSSAMAWHNEGHMMTAEIAWQAMTPGARCRAVRLLETDPIYATGLKTASPLPHDEALFVNAATWPDRIKVPGVGFVSDGDDAKAVGAPASLNVGLSDKRMHKYWHFIDLPVPASAAHSPPSINAKERIELFRDTLANAATPDPLKAYDLAWLLHLVGDVHQPLHTAEQFSPVFKTPAKGEDAGGNSVKVKCCSFHAYKELHGFWDGIPGDSNDLDTAVSDAHALPPAPASAVSIINVGAWVAESHRLAETQAYVAPIKRKAVGPFTLPEKTGGYVDRAEQTTRAQVALGGARLGSLLNTALTWPDASCGT